MWKTWVRSPGGGLGNPLHFSCLESPWTEEPGRLQSMESQRVRHDWATKHSTCWGHSLYTHFEFLILILIFFKCFFFFLHLLGWSCDFIFNLLIWYLTFVYLWVLNHPCLPGTAWLWCMILLMYCIQFVNILLKILHLCSGMLTFNFLFLCPFLVLVSE